MLTFASNNTGHSWPRNRPHHYEIVLLRCGVEGSARSTNRSSYIKVVTVLVSSNPDSE